MNLYTAGSQPGTLSNPVLIYDPAAHTLSYADAHDDGRAGDAGDGDASDGARCVGNLHEAFRVTVTVR